MRSGRHRSGRALAGILVRCGVLGVVASCAGSVDYLGFDKLRGDASVWERVENNLYPKYWVLLPERGIDEPSISEFRVSGLPRSAYWFGLALNPPGSDEALEAVERNHVECDVEIVDSQGKTVIHVWGVMGGPDSAPHVAMKDWYQDRTLALGGAQRLIFRPWQMSVSDMFVPKPSMEYTFRIRLTSSGHGTADLSGSEAALKPVLWAGGVRAGFFAWW